MRVIVESNSMCWLLTVEPKHYIFIYMNYWYRESLHSENFMFEFLFSISFVDSYVTLIILPFL